MSGSPGSLWKDYSALSHRQWWGENKIIGRFHSPLVKSRHNLKGIWGKQASEIWKQKRTVRKTQRGSGLCGEGTPAAKSWWPGDGRGQKCHPWQQPQAMWHLRCPEGISYFVGGDSVRELGFRANVYVQVYMRTSRALMLLLSGQAGKAPITAQLDSPLSRSHEHNYVHHFLWIKKQRQTPGALEEPGWEAGVGMLGLRWIPGPWVEFRGSINLDVKIILLYFHRCPTEIEHFLHSCECFNQPQEW